MCASGESYFAAPQQRRPPNFGIQKSPYRVLPFMLCYINGSSTPQFLFSHSECLLYKILPRFSCVASSAQWSQVLRVQAPESFPKTRGRALSRDEWRQCGALSLRSRGSERDVSLLEPVISARARSVRRSWDVGGSLCGTKRDAKKTKMGKRRSCFLRPTCRLGRARRRVGPVSPPWL